MEELKAPEVGSVLVLYTQNTASDVAEEQAREGSQSIVFCDHSSLNSALEKVPSSSLDEVKVAGFSLDSDSQGHIYRVLKDGAKVAILGISTREEGIELTSDMKMMGFGGIMVAKDESTSALSRFLVAQKPDWGKASSASVATNKLNGGSTTAATKKWTMGTGDLAEMDLVDEDDLLNDGVEVDSSACAPPADGGKKRACKNCSCGLAEVEAAELKGEQAKIDPLVRASGCGSCSKGDAFRCASCPFLGKPAFEPGQEKVVLSMGDDDF
jgi:hypothetical protein